MNQQQKKKLTVIYSAYGLILLISMITCFLHKNMDGFSMSFVAIMTPVLVPIVLKMVRLHSTYEICLVNVIFAFFASIVGSVWGAYSIPYFDKVLHSTSGILIALLGYMIYAVLKKETNISKKNELILSLLFVHSFNMMIAVMWEFFEFAMLVLIGNDGINHYTTGVYDSMTDMLVAMLGGWVILFYIFHYYKTGKKNFWINLTDHFLETNFK